MKNLETLSYNTNIQKLKVFESFKYYCFTYKKHQKAKKYRAMKFWSKSATNRVFYGLKAY